MRFVKCDEQLIAFIGTKYAEIFARFNVVSDHCRINTRPFVFRQRSIVRWNLDERGWNIKRNILQSLDCSTWRVENLCSNNQVFEVFRSVKEYLRLLVGDLRFDL